MQLENVHLRRLILCRVQQYTLVFYQCIFHVENTHSQKKSCKNRFKIKNENNQNYNCIVRDEIKRRNYKKSKINGISLSD